MNLRDILLSTILIAVGLISISILILIFIKFKSDKFTVNSGSLNLITTILMLFIALITAGIGYKAYQTSQESNQSSKRFYESSEKYYESSQKLINIQEQGMERENNFNERSENLLYREIAQNLAEHLELSVNSVYNEQMVNSGRINVSTGMSPIFDSILINAILNEENTEHLENIFTFYQQIKMFNKEFYLEEKKVKDKVVNYRIYLSRIVYSGALIFEEKKNIIKEVNPAAYSSILNHFTKKEKADKLKLLFTDPITQNKELLKKLIEKGIIKNLTLEKNND